MVPDLLTNRLFLRQPGIGDSESMANLHGDPAVMRFIDVGKPLPADVVLSRDLGWLLADYGEGIGYWIGVELVSGRTVGWFGLRPLAHSPLEVEPGYRLKPEFWGRGLATEAATALVEHAFDSAGVQRVFATTMVANVGSWKVMEKAGLMHQRTWFYGGPGPITGAELGDVEHALTLTSGYAAIAGRGSATACSGRRCPWRLRRRRHQRSAPKSPRSSVPWRRR